MNLKLDWLNNHIDRMQQDRGLASLAGREEYAPAASCVELLEMAALFTAARDRAAEPEAGFVGRLRERMLASIDEPGGSP